MGIFLNGVLAPKISLYHHTAHLVYQVKTIPNILNPLPLAGPRYNPFPSVSIRHTLPPFLRYNPFPISFCTPELAKPDKAPTPKAGKTVPVRNGINPANAGKNLPCIFAL